MKTIEEQVRLYISEEYHEQLLREVGITDSLVERVFLDGVKFGYELAKREQVREIGND
jgi:hypothetical protein